MAMTTISERITAWECGGRAGVTPHATRVIRLATPLELTHGGELRACDIGYELVGRPGLPLVVVLGGISASRHVCSHSGDPRAGWWETIVGAGRAIDTRRFCVLGIDYLGGPGASSGPANRDDFPSIDTRDQARAIAAVLDDLGMVEAHAVVGASYGGMVALAFGVLFPQRTSRVVAIGAAHRSHPMATAVRTVQRNIVQLGIETGRASEALRLARGLAVTTYRTAEEFATRFTHVPQQCTHGVRFPVQDYLDHCGSRFADVFPPESFLRLSESIDLHDVSPAELTVPLTLVSVAGDVIVPSWQARELAAGARGPVRLVETHSIYGHDAFLKEVTTMSEVIVDALRECGDERETDGGAQ
jgi:homoserine O-acetyltransferase